MAVESKCHFKLVTRTKPSYSCPLKHPPLTSPFIAAVHGRARRGSAFLTAEMPPTKRKCRECVAAGLPDCKHCICPGCNWCLCRQEAGRGHRPDPARDAPALTTLALLAQNGKGAASVESAPCGALRESSGSVRCRSCRRHNVKKRKADAAIAARLAGSEAPVNPSPTARHITGGSQQGAYFPSGPVWKSTSELGYGDDVASMAWGARNLISTQVTNVHRIGETIGDAWPLVAVDRGLASDVLLAPRRGLDFHRPVWKSHFGRPTPSTRRRPRHYICSMAWRL